ncbi:MAG: hypothetical protein QHJ82_10340, partial [Verrucomicrobiota bacterium]|nr:hypothetical protein [Verrucomicrobiota bacterium]
MSQSKTPPTWQKWLAAAPPIPDFQAADTLDAWLKQREQIRAKLWDLLGKLPPRPNPVSVCVVSRTEHADFTLEKLELDNGAGDLVPCYLLLPKNGQEKSPAILYCHWHGGHYNV